MKLELLTSGTDDQFSIIFQCFTVDEEGHRSMVHQDVRGGLTKTEFLEALMSATAYLQSN
jgi:hypothetical protein